jgi:hypothetical protein
VNRSVHITWIHHNLAATRPPVSSKCATSAPASSVRARAGRARQQPSQVTGGHRGAETVGQTLRGPLHRQVLTGQQVSPERGHPGPVAGRGGGLDGKRAGRDRAAAAHPPLRPVLDGAQRDPRQVEHLPALLTDHRGAGEV